MIKPRIHIPPTPPEPTFYEECCTRAREIRNIIVSMIAIFLIILAGHIGEQAIAFAMTVELPFGNHSEPVKTPELVTHP